MSNYFSSLTKVLEQEANELGKLRTTLQDLLITAVDENPSKSLDKLQNGFLQEHFKLKELYKSVSINGLNSGRNRNN